MSKGLQIIEFAQGIAGPMAGARLVELGASVIKIEGADGDWLRGAAPAMPDNNGESGGDSASFFHLNRGKRSLALGPNPASARALFDALLHKADVLITDRSDEELRALGLEDLCEDAYLPNPRLVRVHISPLGRHGPIRNYQGSELTSQAMAGYTRYLGTHGQPARRLGADVASTGTGMFAVQAVLAAIFARGRTGKGQRVDLSLLNSLLSMKSIHIAAQCDPDVYAGPRVGGANFPPERGWKTRDEPIFFSFGGSVGAEGRPGWVEFVKEIGAEHLLQDKRFDHRGRNSTGHGTDVNALRQVYEKEFARFSADTLVDIIRKHTGNAARYMRADETVAHAQTVALGIVQDVPGRDGSSQRVRGFPVRFSRLKPQIQGVAPRLGEHTAEIARDAGFAEDVVSQLVEKGALRLVA